MSDTGKRKQRGGGDDDPRDPRDKKRFWSDNAKAQGIPQGTRGVLVSVYTGKEVQAGREAVNILTEAYEKLCPAADEGPDVAGGDISALLASEVADLKDTSKQPFSFKTLNIGSLVYVEVKYTDGPSPGALVAHVCREVKATQQNKTRLCNRFYPVEHVCAAKMEAIENLAKEIAVKNFPDDATEGTTFSVEFDRRAAAPNLDRMQVINAFANSIKQPPHKVNLSKPAKTIMVNIVKGTCGVAVVDDFKDLARYNLRALAGECEAAMGKPAEKKERKEEKEKDETDGD